MTHELRLNFHLADPDETTADTASLTMLARERADMAHGFALCDGNTHRELIDALMCDVDNVLDAVLAREKGEEVVIKQRECAVQRDLLAQSEALQWALAGRANDGADLFDKIALENFAWGLTEALRTITPIDEQRTFHPDGPLNTLDEACQQVPQ